MTDADFVVQVFRVPGVRWPGRRWRFTVALPASSVAAAAGGVFRSRWAAERAALAAARAIFDEGGS